MVVVVVVVVVVPFESCVSHDATMSFPVEIDEALVAWLEFVGRFRVALERQNGWLRLGRWPMWRIIQKWIPPFPIIALVRSDMFLQVM